MADKTHTSKIAITMATLESHVHEINSIKSGIKLFNAGKIDFMQQDDGVYSARVEDNEVTQSVGIDFKKDGNDLRTHFCNCGVGNGGDCLCNHIVATVLAIQGGVIESQLQIGKTASATTTVGESNTARAVGSGSLNVFATPMMIALMERAACECLSDGLEDGQTSVGTQIEVEHTAASPLGADITATATIDYVFGKRIEFSVTASDNSGEIGKGKHTRVIVDGERFVAKAEKRL